MRRNWSRSPPEVILAYGGSTVGPLQQVTRTVPIVFVEVIDPVGAGFVIVWRGRAATPPAFPCSNSASSGKWLELLKQIAPRMTRAVVIRDPSSPGGVGSGRNPSGGAIVRVEVTPVGLRDAGEIERAITVRARGQWRPDRDGERVGDGQSRTDHHACGPARVPAVYPLRYFATSGGLISYGPERLEPYRRAPSYVDRILKGEKPADLPVQAPTKYEMVINLKTAKALGLEVPPSCSPALTR